MVDSIRFKRRNDGAVGSARSDPVTGDEVALVESELMVNAAGDWLQGPPAIYAGEAGGLFDEIVKLIPFQPHALLGINPPQSPVLGQVWVNNATGNFNIWNGEQWEAYLLAPPFISIVPIPDQIGVRDGDPVTFNARQYFEFHGAVGLFSEVWSIEGPKGGKDTRLAEINQSGIVTMYPPTTGSASDGVFEPGVFTPDPPDPNSVFTGSGVPGDAGTEPGKYTIHLKLTETSM